MDDNTVDPAGMAGAEGANVEFFNPKLRQELEEKEIKNGKKGSNNAGSGATEGESTNNPWVWLTSYSRIPVSSRSLVDVTVEINNPVIINKNRKHVGNYT
jgi:hypothetical protein